MNLCLIGMTGLLELAMYTGKCTVNLLRCLHSKGIHVLLVKWSPPGQGTA